VALSSCEAEYIVACYAACQALWLDSLLEELKIEIQRLVELYLDNKSTISLAMNPVAHGRSKHIETRFHFLHEKVSKKQLDLKYYSTEMQLANILIKGLKVNKFIVLKDKLGLSSIKIMNQRGLIVVIQNILDII